MNGAAEPWGPAEPWGRAQRDRPVQAIVVVEPGRPFNAMTGGARRGGSMKMGVAINRGITLPITRRITLAKAAGWAVGCLVAISALTGCAAPPTQRITDAATSPLTDLNLRQVTVPPVLAEARQQVYAVPVIHDCIALATEIHALDEALGPDLDVAAPANDQSLIERGGALAGNAALDAIKGAAEGLIPYRSWVRKLSGAERASKAVAAAISAGMVRRGFLKGLLQSQTCH